MLSCCQIYFCEQETTGIVYHHRSESLIRSRLFLLEPVCFLISHWDAYMPWHDRALSSSTSFSIRVLHQPQAQVAMHWGTPATLSHISSEAKIYWGQNLLLWFIPFLILIISNDVCSFCYSPSVTSSYVHQKRATRQKGMKCKVRVSIAKLPLNVMGTSRPTEHVGQHSGSMTSYTVQGLILDCADSFKRI